MIIVEGPDNSGKSTLVSQLSKEFNLLVAERPHGPPKSVEDLIDRATKLLLKQDKKRYIIDRHPIFGEDIYGPILRGHNKWLENEDIHYSLVSLLKHSQERKSTFIIYCRPPDEVVLNLSTHQVKDYDTKEHLKSLEEKASEVLKAYDSKMDSWANFKYNYKDPNSYELLINTLRKEYFDECE